MVRIFVTYDNEDNDLMLTNAYYTMEEADEFCEKGFAKGWQTVDLKEGEGAAEVPHDG